MKLEPCPFCGCAEVRFHGTHPDDAEDCDGCHSIYCPRCKVFVDYSVAIDPNNEMSLEELHAESMVLWNIRVGELQ